MSSKGFTIAECVIAMLLLAITLVGSMAFYTYSQQTLTLSSHRRIATELASAELETIRNAGFAQIPAVANPWADPAHTHGGVEIGGIQGAREIIGQQEVDVTTPEAGLAYRQVTVTITWHEPWQSAGTQQTATLTTCIAQ